MDPPVLYLVCDQDADLPTINHWTVGPLCYTIFVLKIFISTLVSTIKQVTGNCSRSGKSCNLIKLFNFSDQILWSRFWHYFSSTGTHGYISFKIKLNTHRLCQKKFKTMLGSIIIFTHSRAVVFYHISNSNDYHFQVFDLFCVVIKATWGKFFIPNTFVFFSHIYHSMFHRIQFVVLVLPSSASTSTSTSI